MTPKRAVLALRFVAFIGIVNLFADMTYEGGRGEVGAFLHHLGANAALVGLIAGGGEFAGYAIRMVSGTIADRTGRYWVDAWAGYIINMLCVPALALAGTWPAAAGLIIGERLGRGIRRPVTSAIIAQAGREIGHGRAFGLNELLDQIGATVGPLIAAFAIWRSGSFSLGFGVLIIPALLTLAFLIPATAASREIMPSNRDASGPTVTDKSLFWRYAIGGALIAAGYVDFALIAFQFQREHIVSTAAISVVFSAAMAVGGISAPLFGRMLDRRGNVAIALALCVTALATALAFLGQGFVAEAGAALWGVGTAVQDALVLALISKLITQRRGATTFGLYDLIFGASWFAGSAVCGFLLDRSPLALVLFSIVLQCAAMPFFLVRRNQAPAAN